MIDAPSVGRHLRSVARPDHPLDVGSLNINVDMEGLGAYASKYVGHHTFGTGANVGSCRNVP
jgi:hypothetical protein